MSDFEIDDSEIAMFIKALGTLQEEFPMKARALMRKVGNKARVKVRAVARSSVTQHTGDYVRSIVRGKVWTEDGNTYNVRVYPKQKMAWYAGLIENGFIHTGHGPNKSGGKFVPGKHVFERSTQQFEADFYSTMEAEFVKIVNKIP